MDLAELSIGIGFGIGAGIEVALETSVDDDTEVHVREAVRSRFVLQCGRQPSIAPAQPRHPSG